jgi:hypothetical protein
MVLARYENEDEDDKQKQAKQSKDYIAITAGDNNALNADAAVEDTSSEMKRIKPGALISSAFTNIRTVHAYSMETWVSPSK